MYKYNNDLTITELQKLKNSISNIIKLYDNNICKDCNQFLDDLNDTYPNHFYCQKFHDLIMFPVILNEVVIHYDKNNNLQCLSFIEKDK